ncbi:hypothetical protein [Staphylococcus aureus]|uniref:hypothetical protein n=1 Tax=Staphylococcus aureus TaxID=1280 RepID=UPI00397A740B
MKNANFVVDIKETKKPDGNYEVVFVLQNGEETDPIILGGPVDLDKFLPKN